MKLRLTPKLTLIFVLFAAALLIAVNLLGYSVGQASLKQAAIDELESTAGEKQAALETWLDRGLHSIEALAASPIVLEETSALAAAPSKSAEGSVRRNTLLEEFEPRISSGEFLVVLVLDPQTGKVLMASDPEEEGKSRGDQPYFLEGKREAYLSPIYFSRELQAPAIMATAPVLSKEGDVVGVLAGQLNLSELNAIIQRHSGVHETDEALLVNTSHQFITQPRFLPDPAVLQQGIDTEPVNRCLEGKSGDVFADDYRGVPVIAVYRWLPTRQMCLIVKIDEAEVLAQQYSFGIKINLINLAALLTASLIALALSRAILQPILTLQAAVQRYGRGDLSIRLPETRYDELGSLARAFNTMAASLAEKENQLKEYSRELESRVEERTAELQRSQKHFQTLIENAPDGIAVLGLDGKLRQVTPSTQQILGYSLKDAEGQDPALLTHPDDLPGLLEVLNDLIQNPGKVVRAKYRFQHKDGSWRWLESTISNLIQEPGIEAIVFNYRDVTERKQAEEALTESEEKFKYIFGHSVVGNSITHIDGTLEVNKAFCEMLGYSQHELVNKKWQEITHPEDIEPSNRVIELLLSGEKESIRFIKRYLHKTGSVVWGDVSISLRRDHEDQPLYFMTAVLDITERKQAENQLADALAFTESILTSSPVGIFTYRLSGQCLSANAAAAEMVGATIEQLKNQNFRELESWKRSGLYDLAEHAIASKKLTAADVHIKTTFGKEAWYRAQFLTFHSAGEELLLMIFNDISERKQAEEALRVSEDRFRRYFELGLVGMAITSPTKGVMEVNDEICLILGYPRDELLKMDWVQITHPDDLPADRAQFNRVLAGEIDSYSLDKRFIRKDGRIADTVISVKCMRHEDGSVDYFLALVQDITDRKRAEEALQEKERLLSEAQHIGQIGSLSYDITGDRFQFSDEMYYLLDISAEKFQHNSKDFLTLVYPSDRPDAATWFIDVRDGWQVKSLDFRLFRRNGELRYLHCKGALEFNSEGKPVRFIGTTQDVTERKLAEIQINQQIKHLTALSEIDRAIISGLDQRQTLEVILSQTLLQLQVDAADILLLDSDGQSLRYAAGQGFHTPLMEKIYVPLGKSFAGRVAKDRRLLKVPSLEEQVNDPLFDILVTEEKFVSYVGVPLIIMNEVKGVLEVFHRGPFQPYQEWLDFLNTLAGQATIAIENAALLGNLKTSNAELSQAYDATIEGWSHAMDLRDKETEGHTQRVVELTIQMAQVMGIDASQLPHIRRGALLHDIGKLGIPDRVLLKPDKLTTEEWEIMQKHPEYAYEMLAPIQYLKPALPIPYFHHEKWDGSGYPLGLRGEQIPLEARIFAVVDVWDALRSDRPYRKAWTVERTLEYIRSLAGTHFDPTVVDYFLELMKS
jgi:PAS domain S-box-containing protein